MARIIVTGASAGIGLAIAQALLTHPTNHRLLLCANSNVLPLQHLQKSHPDRIIIFTGDMADAQTPARLLALYRETHGPKLDALVLNHGTLGACKRIAETAQSDWEAVFRVNVGSYVGLVQAAIPLLRAADGGQDGGGGGRIILTSSGAAESAYTSWGAYGASKAAVNHLAKTLGKEERGIMTVAVRPGMVDTMMQEEIRGREEGQMDEEDRVRFVDAWKQGKLVRPEGPGGVIARLAVEGERELTGLFLSWNDEKLAKYQAGSA